MATLICSKDDPEFSTRFRTGGMDFDLFAMCDSLNATYFDGELNTSGLPVTIPNPKTDIGLGVVVPMGIEHMAVTDGSRIFIHPMLTMNDFPLDVSLVIRVLLHEMVHVLCFQRYGDIAEHESKHFGDIARNINERLGLPETERDELKFWPTFPIPLLNGTCLPMGDDLIEVAV